MPTDFSALHAAHVAALLGRFAPVLERFNLDSLVVHSGVLQKKTAYDDQFWPLRLNPHFQHWLPLDEAGALLVLRPGKTPALWRSTARDYWEAPARTCPSIFGPFEVHSVPGPIPLKAIVSAHERGLFLGEDDAIAAALGVPRADADAEFLSAVDELRVRKTPYEVRCLADANARAWLGHVAVREQFSSGDF